MDTSHKNQTTITSSASTVEEHLIETIRSLTPYGLDRLAQELSSILADPRSQRKR